MENGDATLPGEAGLDFKTFRRLDILEINTPEGIGDQRYRGYKLRRILGVDLYIDGVDPGKALEQQRLAFHHGFAGKRAQVAQPKHCGTVADNRHQIALAGVQVGIVGIFGDFPAGLCHAGTVGQGQVLLSLGRRGQFHADFAGGRQSVIVQGSLLEFLGHRLHLQKRSQSI